MPQSQAVEEWLAFSAEDLQAATVLFREGIYNQAAFHSQQCVEKLFKAYLLSRGKSFPKVHDLNELFDICLHAGAFFLLQWKEEIMALSLYYVPTRYPDAFVGSLPNRLPHKTDAKEALESAEKLHRHMLKELE